MFNIDLTASNYLIRDLNQASNSILSDIIMMPDVASHYESEESLINNIKAGNIISNNESLLDDSESYISWTYVADYKAHPLSRNAGKNYYIHIRINRDNKIEFAIFDKIVKSNSIKGESFLYNKNGNTGFLYNLKIATKDEAEKFLLTADKKHIKVSALPKYAGYLNDYSEEHKNNHIFSVFGNIWTYWYTVSNNTLYFCGFPILVDTEEKGLIYDAENNIIETELPPTILNYKTKVNSTIKLPLDLIYKADDEHENKSGAKYILNVYGDTSEETEIINQPIAFLDRSKTLKNLIIEDIATIFDSYSVLGGVYQTSDGVSTVGPDEINISYKEGDCIEGYSGFYPFKTSYINKTQDDIFIQYKDAIHVNGFNVSIINNNIQIIIGNNLFYLGNGTNINVDDITEWDDITYNSDINPSPAGGNNGWATTLGPGAYDDNNNIIKRNTPPIIIQCGDIGYEYYTSTITKPWVIETSPTYEVYGNQYRDKEAVSMFEYDIDFAKLDEIIVNEKSRNIDDNEKNVLSKKLSRKLIIEGFSYENDYSLWGAINPAAVSFEKIFPLENIEENNFYITRDGSLTSIGGANGPAAMTIEINDNNDSINLVAKSCNREYDIESNWGNGFITTDIYSFNNNNLKVPANLCSDIYFSERAFELVEEPVLMENKKIKVTNTLFNTHFLNAGEPEIIRSFHPAQDKCGTYNPKKISIRYSIRKAKLIPRKAFLQNLITEFVTKYSNNTDKLKDFEPDIEIKCGNKFISDEEDKSIKSEIVYVESASRTIENETKSEWEVTDETYENTISKLKPIEINFKNIKLESLPVETPFIPVSDENDDSSTCAIDLPLVKDSNWKGYPQLKLNFEIDQTLLRKNTADENHLIPFTLSAYGNTWWESASEDYLNDTLSHKFKIAVPSEYEPLDNKIYVEILNSPVYSIILDSLYSKSN